MTNEWCNPNYVKKYLEWMNDMPQRQAGEATLLAEVGSDVRRVLDLGCGDGHLLSLVLARFPEATGVGLDFSQAMLEQAASRFGDSSRVKLVEHDLNQTLPELGVFDTVVSSFAIHHCDDRRKRALYEEVWSLLEEGGAFCNLEHVASPNPRVHESFLAAMGMTADDEDPSNKLLDVHTQLAWLRELGFQDVDCFWRWRELALLVGRKPAIESEMADGGERVLVETPSAREMFELDQRITAYNRKQAGRDDFQPLQLVIRDGHGNAIAGLKGQTGWEWLHVEILLVDEPYKKQGLGGRLLQHAERVAQQRGCRGACLSTFCFQAPDFYRQLGYKSFGQIDHYPDDHTLYFMQKRFDAGSA